MVAGGLRVRGGAGGVAAQFEHLDAAAAALHRSAAAIDDALDALRYGHSALQALSGGLHDPVGAVAVEAELLSVAGGVSGAAMAAGTNAAAVAGVVDLYRLAEQTADQLARSTLLVSSLAAAPVVGPALRSVLGLYVLASDDVGRRVDGPADLPGGAADGSPGPSASSTAASTPAPGPGPTPPSPADGPAPGLLAARLVAESGNAVVLGAVTGPVALAAGRRAAPAAAGWLVGRMRLLQGVGGPGTTATTLAPVPVAAEQVAAGAPRGTADLLRRVQQTGDTTGDAARVRVERGVSATGRPVAVVYLPGTQTWQTASSTNPYDTTTNLEAVAEESTAVADAAVQSLRAAGVTRDTDLLVVGHSLGGIAAAQLVSSPGFQEQFHPVGLVTAGSPTGAFAIPDGVTTVALEHTEDLVPLLDGAANPDTPSLTTVVADTPAGHDAHGLAGYLQTASAVDASDDPSLVAARARLGEFFAPGERTVSDYVAERVR